jgi:hypothetical protein
MEANTRITIALGKTMSSIEVDAGQRVRAWGAHFVRERLFKALNLSAIVTPTTGMAAPPLSR